MPLLARSIEKGENRQRIPSQVSGRTTLVGLIKRQKRDITYHCSNLVLELSGPTQIWTLCVCLFSIIGPIYQENIWTLYFIGPLLNTSTMHPPTHSLIESYISSRKFTDRLLSIKYYIF